MEKRSKRPLGSVLAAFLGILVAVVIVGGIVAFQVRPKNAADKKVAQIVTNPDSYYGSRVSLSGKINSVIGSRAFTIDNPGIAGGRLLIISRKSLEPIGGSGIDESFLRENDRVQIKGRVQNFDLRTIEKELGADLVDDVFIGWQGRPVIIADDVEENR